MRQKIVAGNWKMNTNLQEGVLLANKIAEQHNNNNVKVILIPPFTHLDAVKKKITHTGISTGAQNCATNEKGAFTGEVSAEMIKSTGAEYVVIGHSERRAYYYETNDILKQKTDTALNNKLIPIFCCGETLEERNSGAYFNIIKQQIQESTFHLDKTEFEKIIIAYEPVWAIGTGITATPGQAEEIHSFIRKTIEKKYGNDTAGNISIIYGGSCKPSNAKDIFSNPNVDGGLIGGASLNADDFIAITNSF